MSFDMVASLSVFNKALDDWEARNVSERLVTAQKAIVLQGYRMLTQRAGDMGNWGSPVWTGRYRASIRVGVGAPDTSVAPPPTADQIAQARGKLKGLTAKQKGMVAPGIGRFSHVWRAVGQPSYGAPQGNFFADKLNGLKPFEKVYLSNSVPYVRVIEFGGHSVQAPDGVFRVTANALAEWATAQGF